MSVVASCSLCCSCGGQVQQMRSARLDDGRLFIVAVCVEKECRSVVQFDIDDIIAGLYDNVLVPYNRNVN